MAATSRDFDVVVAGAGTAGAAAAAFLAEAGRKVALVERRSLDQGGARWINAVPVWLLDRAGVARPEGSERHGNFGTASFRSPMDKASVDIEGVPVWDLDMRALGDRLRTRAIAAGVTVFDHACLGDLTHVDGRPRTLEMRVAPPGKQEHRLRLSASLFVDATGIAGALRTKVDALRRDCPMVPMSDVCSAASGLYEIRDPDGARRFLDRHRLVPGHTLAWMGPEGGYSTIIVSIEEDLESVSFVTGTIAAGPFLSGPALLERTVGSYPWVGDRRFGGDALIPLRRPYDRLTTPGAALIGDAACQVFSVHGSGVGNGLVAARLLAEALEGAADPGSEDVLWRYQSGYQRLRGAHCAPFDLFRRRSQTWKPEDVEGLLDAGVLSQEMWSQGIMQRLSPPDPDTILRGLRAVRTHPRVVAGVGPMVARMYAVHGLYRAYPREPDMRRLRLWSRTTAAAFGERSELKS